MNIQQEFDNIVELDFEKNTLLPMFKELVDKLQSTSGRIEKENILKEYDNLGIRNILQFIFDPYTVTGISKKKISKKLIDYNKKCVSLFDDNDGWPTIQIETLPALLSYLRKHNTGTHDDIKTCQLFIKNNLEYKDLIEGIVTKEVKLGVQPKTLNKVFGEGFIKSFDIMLAQRYFEDPERLLPQGTEYILTTKLDGIRCVIVKDEDETHFYTRQGQTIEGLVELEKVAKLLPTRTVYDGELLLENPKGLSSKDLYRETVKVVNKDGEKRGVIFNCFDIVALEAFQKGYDPSICKGRKEFLHNWCTRNNEEVFDRLNDEMGNDSFNQIIQNIKEAKPWHFFKEVEILYQGIDQTQIQYWLDKITSEGGEGVMINLANAPYECKRSKGILKVKKFNSADVRVIALEEGTGANEGRLGAIRVEFIGPDGKIYTCKVGSGFTEEERKKYWKNYQPKLLYHKGEVIPSSFGNESYIAEKDIYEDIKFEDLIGKIVEIDYFEITNNQSNNDYSMRFPTWKGSEYIRFDKTEISMY